MFQLRWRAFMLVAAYPRMPRERVDVLSDYIAVTCPMRGGVEDHERVGGKRQKRFGYAVRAHTLSGDLQSVRPQTICPYKALGLNVGLGETFTRKPWVVAP
jgi:hypothetical protein